MTNKKPTYKFKCEHCGFIQETHNGVILANCEECNNTSWSQVEEKVEWKEGEEFWIFWTVDEGFSKWNIDCFIPFGDLVGISDKEERHSSITKSFLEKLAGRTPEEARQKLISYIKKL